MILIFQDPSSLGGKRITQRRGGRLTLTQEPSQPGRSEGQESSPPSTQSPSEGTGSSQVHTSI